MKKTEVDFAVVMLTIIATAVSFLGEIPSTFAKTKDNESPEYKQGFKDGSAAEISDEETDPIGSLVSVDKYMPCTSTPDYCTGFIAGYKLAQQATALVANCSTQTDECKFSRPH